MHKDCIQLFQLYVLFRIYDCNLFEIEDADYCSLFNALFLETADDETVWEFVTEEPRKISDFFHNCKPWVQNIVCGWREYFMYDEEKETFEIFLPEGLLIKMKIVENNGEIVDYCKDAYGQQLFEFLKKVEALTGFDENKFSELGLTSLVRGKDVLCIT